MNNLVFPTVMGDITINRYSLEKRIGYRYETSLPDNKTGFAEVTFNPIIEFRDSEENDIFNVCLKLGLAPDMIITDIEKFFVNGTIPSQTRTGLGRFILEDMLTLAAMQYAGIAYSKATTKAMSQFLEKNNFEELTKFRWHYFMLLE
ncbi:MAG: hypothetical protein ABIJ08_00240 [Nanoarchaeota archaeon]